MKKSVLKNVKKIFSVLRGRKGTEYCVSVHAKGIHIEWMTLEGESGERTMHWDDIVMVTSYKRDLITSDMICLLFVFLDGFQFEFNEEMPCWKKLVDILPQYLIGCPPYSDWWSSAAAPAFDTNEIVIYRREILDCKRGNIKD